MVNAILATKQYMTQLFDEESKNVIPVTILKVKDCKVVGLKSEEKDGYSAIVLGYGRKRKPTKPQMGVYKELGYVPLYVQEFRVDSTQGVEVGTNLKADIFEKGTKLDIRGISKGKGFQGVVKRYGFAGGPKTHGQSDRHRAPGSIGGMYPQRVLKGKKMPGRMGGDVKRMISKLVSTDAADGLMIVKGSVPGGKNALLNIVKIEK